MDEKTASQWTDRDLRVHALDAAVGHRLSTEDAATVVKNAEKYFAFMNHPAATA